jgi:predicted HTH domain antitoxin
MGVTTLLVDVPEEIVSLLGSREDAAARAREALVLGLVREARISHGKAAELLGLTRWAMLDLLAQHHIQMGPTDPGELLEDVAAARRASQHAGGSGQ